MGNSSSNQTNINGNGNVFYVLESGSSRNLKLENDKYVLTYNLISIIGNQPAKLIFDSHPELTFENNLNSDNTFLLNNNTYILKHDLYWCETNKTIILPMSYAGAFSWIGTYYSIPRYAIGINWSDMILSI